MEKYRIGLLPNSNLLVGTIKDRFNENGIYTIKISIEHPDGRKLAHNDYVININE